MGYVPSARRIADRRMILAGYRLADLLTGVASQYRTTCEMLNDNISLNPSSPRCIEMDNPYDAYGIVLKTWFAPKENESRENSYEVYVSGWSHSRRLIERDGLVSFQVTVHSQERNCYTCKERVCFIKEQLANQNVQCFWTYEPDDASLYVTVGPPSPELRRYPRLTPELYLSFLLGQIIYRPSQSRIKQRKPKARSRKRRKDLH